MKIISLFRPENKILSCGVVLSINISPQFDFKQEPQRGVVNVI